MHTEKELPYMRKLKVIQIGCSHEHASGKINTIKLMNDTFELIGFVDDTDICLTPRLNDNCAEWECYKDVPRLTLEEALNYPDLDLVTVEVPNNDLVPFAEMCLERKIPMHMDKPGGPDLERYKKLIDGCEAANLPFQMGYMFRGNPALNQALDLARKGAFGDIFEIKASMNHCYGEELYQNYISKLDGGIMYNLGCHLFDLFISFLGEPDDVVSFLKSAPGYPDHVKNNCLAVLSYPHATATAHICSKDPDNTVRRRFRLVGTKGTFEIMPMERFDKQDFTARFFFKEDNEFFTAGEHIVNYGITRDRYEIQLAELAAILRGTGKDSFTRQHDFLVHKVSLAASGYIPWK